MKHCKPSSKCSGLTHKQRLAAAKALIEDRVALSEPDLEAKLRGDDAVFDFAAPSLQNRLLDYFETRFGYKEAREHLQRAEQSRRAVLKEVAREALLGLHPKNRELHPLVAGFSDYDLWRLNRVVLAEKPAEELKTPQLIQLISSKLREGRGEDVMRYLTERLDHHRARLGSDAKNKTLEVFNSCLVVVAWMWTFPEYPMWMIPGAAAALFVSQSVGEDFNRTAYNRLIHQHGLERLDQKLFDRFISPKMKDAKGISLQKELESVIKMPLSSFRRGASAANKK